MTTHGIKPRKAEGTDGYDYAFGKCLTCGADVPASCYWLGPNVVYRIGAHLVGFLFTPGHNKPFCNHVCAGRYHLGQGHKNVFRARQIIGEANRKNMKVVK